jgi:hypothetical protein
MVACAVAEMSGLNQTFPRTLHSDHVRYAGPLEAVRYALSISVRIPSNDMI